ncbi:tRNA-uridine aminocarboxypropyltransferase [Roseateles violae]|uniref:tRNA-uridine aminocarboxypropyltransferase n=1 Tax=Roseateles violae TaxID=3058042 RepID=A0ABT8DRZ1_9BURK|nr:tRNA-uridine aminocarboxypropyltransferase [Pelomonas sp. PFR6]MDN3919064.1 tRNA-uridine aminocarboxypropyltransferase [Pelomonas sp. PFR6]
MSAPASSVSTRARCLRCERPLTACICRFAARPPLAGALELLILQHPLERHQPKGTARLLQLGLANCRLLCGERFEPPPADGRIGLLLYPDTPDMPEAPPLPQPLPPPERLRLVVLDGSWRKSRVLLHANRWLQALPRLALDGLPDRASPYAALRKARRAGQLSTLEAGALALQRLEPGLPLDALRQGFEAFVAWQRQQAGSRRLP